MIITDLNRIDSYYTFRFKKLLKKPSTAFAVSFLSLLLLCAIVLPMIYPLTYYDTVLSSKNAPPSLFNWFGTDELGRDIFIRIFWGARISLFVGIVAAFLDVFIGMVYGAISGYCGGRVDEFMMRVVDIFHAIPNLLIIIMLMVVFGNGIFTIILAMACTGWLNMARLIRTQVLRTKELDFVIAAEAYGASSYWVIRKHLLPNCMGTIITTLTFSIPVAIFTETFLSFLGLGVQAPIASWGTMAHDGLNGSDFYPWRLIFPALFISLTMLSFNLLGDGLRDVLDERRV